MSLSHRRGIVGVTSLAVELAIMTALIFLANRTGISPTNQIALYLGAGACIVAAGVTAKLTARGCHRQSSGK
ncbi:hypothetical protein [Sanguibacter sp. Leaf3]|uniref:hypothetical protein n=1 Tax=Sanguibacter sp. Leaf3 TaxID=1736209 RepID=UPI0006FE1951|nr:hypothetical protein [Sanguibacter sp. Leaf3]KQT99539.1 hypothetical protein ASG53_01340 [Sanguibacter sp. Leaf3]